MSEEKEKAEYVVGFLIDPDRELVVLIRKERPRWQKGRLNGPGGHVELHEDLDEAMQREFVEETGLVVDDWRLIVEMTTDSAKVYFFSAEWTVGSVRTVTDEKIVIATYTELPPNVIPHIRWLIPLCLDRNIEKPVEIAVEDEYETARAS